MKLDCWTKPIWFIVNNYVAQYDLSNAYYVAYGWPGWFSRSVWIVPGTDIES